MKRAHCIDLRVQRGTGRGIDAQRSGSSTVYPGYRPMPARSLLRWLAGPAPDGPPHRDLSRHVTARSLPPSAPPHAALQVPAQIIHPWGNSLSRERAEIGPVTCCGRRAGGDCFAGFPRRCRVSCRRAVRGQAGVPAAVAPVRARARTNELDAGERRPMIGGGEQPAGLWLPGRVAGSGPEVRGSGGVGLTSTHSAARAGRGP